MARPKNVNTTENIEAQAQANLDASGNNPPTPQPADSKPKESKAERFARLAPKRIDNVANRLRHVAALANKATYAYTDEQRDKLLAYIDKEVQRIKDAFGGTVEKNGGFTF